jgi:hypothetical protein
MKIYKLIIRLLALPLLVFFLYSCEKETLEPYEFAGEVSYTDDIVPIFENKCVGCHGGTREPNLSTGTAHETLKAGNYLTPANESALLYSGMTADDHPVKPSEEEKQKILKWIKDGAPEN